MKRAVLALAVLMGGPALPIASAKGQEEVQISRFSEKPVPRFESLRHDKVNGRVGPSRDHKVKWEYIRRGLPVLIIKESGDWRYVRDPAGDEAWIERTQLASQRNAVALTSFVLKAGRAPDSADVANVAAGVLVELGTCDGGLCQITAGNFRGWAPRKSLWGATATKG